MIYHVTTTREWATNIQNNSFAPDAFAREGFIHSCESAQLAGVLQRYFKGRHDLVLLHIDEQKLTCQLKYETATAGELFPHLFGRINLDAVVRVENPFEPQV